MPATSGSNILLWLRADLRTTDNPALHRASIDAAAANGAVIAVFTICPKQWEQHDWAGVRVDFVLRHLSELSADLAKLGIPLLIETTPTFSTVPTVLTVLARKHRCSAIYWNNEYELNEMRRDAAVAAACDKAGVRAVGFTDQALIEPGGVRTGEGRFFTVFTPFKGALYRIIEERGSIKAVPKPKKQDPTGIDSSSIPDRLDAFTSHIVDAGALWPAGERAAAKRLNTFCADRIRSYKDERDRPSLDSTSSLSPYLAVGSISSRQCILAAKEHNSGKLDGPSPGATCWISELAWREFYRHLMIGYPRVCMGRNFKPETERLKWDWNDKLFDAWCAGRTGFPIVDAGMRQLAATGWMHNRVRMIVAMFLTKDLFFHWRHGERFFMRHLIDGDLGSNNGGWQWSASTGTDAAPYFRIFNTFSQSRTCDPSGDYIRRWVPELAGLEGGEKGPIHDPSELPPLARAQLDYPAPIVDRTKTKDRVMKAFQSL
jgi:deoxyribodipyrimidine photo-lyase